MVTDKLIQINKDLLFFRSNALKRLSERTKLRASQGNWKPNCTKTFLLFKTVKWKLTLAVSHFKEVFHCQCCTKAFIDFKSLQFLGRHLPPRNYASFVPVISTLPSLEEDHNC